MFHLHFNSKPDYKVFFKSAILLIIVIGSTIILNLKMDMEASWRMFVMAVPFALHIVISFFVKNKESWVLGAILGTLISLLICIITLLVVL